MGKNSPSIGERQRRGDSHRRDSFLIERNGKPVTRVVPVAGATGDATLADALAAWTTAAPADRTFADDLAAVDASDRPPVNRWES